MCHNGTNRSEVLRNIKAVLYDGDWINSDEIESITEKTRVRTITALDFSGHCLLDVMGNVEELYGISLDDNEIQNCDTFGDIVTIIMPLIEVS